MPTDSHQRSAWLPLRRASTGLLPALAAGFALAAPAGAVEQFPGTWLVFLGGGAVPVHHASTPWRYSINLEARYPDVGSGTRQYVLRPAVAYALNNSISLWIGYGRFETRAASGARASENRPWQQLSWTALRSARATLALRLRLEERLLSTASEAALTLRSRVRLDLALPRSRATRLHLSMEPFLELRDSPWNGRVGASQARGYLGLSHTLGRSGRVGYGYQAQYLRAPARENLLNHLLMLSYQARF